MSKEVVLDEIYRMSVQHNITPSEITDYLFDKFRDNLAYDEHLRLMEPEPPEVTVYCKF